MTESQNDAASADAGTPSDPSVPTPSATELGVTDADFASSVASGPQPEATGLEIAVVGMAGRFPGAHDLDELWHNLRDGVESIRFFSDDELLAAGVPAEVLSRPDYVKARGVIDGREHFDAALFGFSPREAELIDPQHRLFLETAWRAFEDAGQFPEHATGPIGIYAGSSQSWYYWRHIHGNQELLAGVPPFQAAIGNERDFLATRVSYKLKLDGPSLTVQTACSTSLVAVHLACQGLLSGECELALAGGVSLAVPAVAGYFYHEGGIVSPDGHCRAFDARAAGTVAGEGVGLVVLKRLEDALADGDRIRAVIKGSAVNNDGGFRVGYTAPSVEGQARVIRAALDAADVDPRTVTYVEAHGAATPLGDPTEVNALIEAFGNGHAGNGHNGDRQRGSLPKQPYCGLGSIKTNIGHLDAAAGIAGFIKTVLALEHGELPPSLHFDEPNPQIDFDAGPFYVNRELRPWPAGGEPRRAGVSSFGLGGTNAHVVLEEAPPPAAAGGSRPCQLLVLSARSEAVLDTFGERLADDLEARAATLASQGVTLADVAATLQLGRGALPVRRARVVDAADAADATGLAAALRDPLPWMTAVAPQGERPVSFLLSGLGDEYVDMGRELYRHEPTFREHFDACCAGFERHLGEDLRPLIHPEQRTTRAAAGPLDLRRMLGRGADADAEDVAANELAATRRAQPAVGAVGYALARLWMDWGVTPRALIGYSLGEYLAACLAGVLELDDALRLVAGRALLIDELPPGRMLAVPLAASEVEALLDGELSLAAVNAPLLSVVAGPAGDVDDLAATLEERGVASRKLAAHHAFHSTMMEPVAARFRELLHGVDLRPPRLPFLSNVTGTWASSDDVTDPDYWVRHLCQTVRFSEGLSELLKRPGDVLLEVGPGRMLGTFAKQHADEDAERLVLTSLAGDDAAAGSELRHVLTTLGRLWLGGARIDWRGFLRHERRRKVTLAGYPFSHGRFWVDRPHQPADPAPAVPATPATHAGEPTPDAAPAAVRSRHRRPQLPSAYAAPANELEAVVVDIWQDLLGLREVGIHDSFFELGGHSLLATQVVARLRDLLAVEVPLRTLSAAMTPADLAVEIRALQAVGVSSRPAVLPRAVPDPANQHVPFPLTDVQEAYWVGRGSSLQLGNVATHYYLERDTETLDLARYEAAWQRLVERHPMLRTIFLAEGRQQILEEIPRFRIATLDLRGRPEEEVEAELAARRREMSHQVLPADRWPLFEIRATLLDGGRTRLHMSYDFLIFDAWSFEILHDELRRLYEDPQTELHPLEITFRDYVLAEEALRESELWKQSRSYWLDRLEDFPAAPDLPLAIDPASLEKPYFTSRAARLDKERWSALKDRAKRLGLTPTGFLLAVFAEILGRWCRRSRFTLNLTLFNRLPLHPQVDDLVGDFSSLILLAVDNRSGATFEERARQLQMQLWDDLDHRYFSGVRVMRELARVRGSLAASIMPVVVTSTINLSPSNETPRKPTGGGKHVYSVSQTPQVWLDHQITEIGGSLVFNWDAVEDLFPAGLLDDMFAAYRGLLENLATREGAWKAERFALPAEHLAARRRANDTGSGEAGLLHAPFFARAAEQPERPAVITAERELTYGELARAARRVTRDLRAGDAWTDAPAPPLVAVVTEKGWEQAAAVMGILAAGAAYLPIDPELPEERRSFLMGDAGVRQAVTTAEVDGRLSWPDGVERIRIAASWLDEAAEGAAPDGEPMLSARTPNDLAYVIYTSGSTGVPKGVAIEHGSAFNTIADVNRRFRVGPEDRVFALSALTFDLSVYDVFGPLAAGGALVVPPGDASRDPAVWAELIARHRVTLWNSVPALMVMLAEYAHARAEVDLSSLRQVLLSGDWIPVALPERVRELTGGAQVVSLGGATEASIWSISYPIGEVDPSWSSIPYGRPLEGQRFHVLDDDLEPRPNWVPGELYIAGCGLARGYLGDEVRTRASFFEHPGSGERLYRTGDLGRYLPSGDIEFLGREDLQVKIQGYRIELGEIEATLAGHPDVDHAVVTVLGGSGPGQHSTGQRLAGYVVARSGAAVDGTGVREFLAEKLPAYMVPDTVAVLDRLPLTANGKVDRDALPALSPKPGGAAEAAPRSATAELTEQVTAMVAQVLHLDQVDPRANLLELGATSIEIIKLANLLHETFRCHPDMEELFGLPDLLTLIAYYEERLDRDPEPATQSPAPAPADDPHADFYKLILDPEERDRFKAEQHALRPVKGGSQVELELDPTWDADLVERRSWRQFSPQPLERQRLSRLLGCLRTRTNGKQRWFYGSAGGLYPIQVYLWVKPGRVEGLAGGTWYYHPTEHRLVALREDIDLDRGIHAWVNKTIFDQSAFSLFMVADMATMGPMYGRPGKDYCFIEAGLMSQLLETTATHCEIGLCQIGVGGIDLTGLPELFDLGERHLVVHCLVGGALDPELGDGAQDAAPLHDAWEEGEI